MTRGRRAALCLTIASAAALADHSPGEQTYFPCRSCHGDLGQGSEAIHAPPLAGQLAGYLARQLRHYRDGLRGKHPEDTYGRQMALMAANLDDAEVEAVAAYIATLPPMAGKTEPAKIAPADAPSPSHYTPCSACHGRSGEGNAALASPRIASLPVDYSARQLRHFRDGIRGMGEESGPVRQMREAARGLSDDDIAVLAAYLADL